MTTMTMERVVAREKELAAVLADENKVKTGRSAEAKAQDDTEAMSELARRLRAEAEAKVEAAKLARAEMLKAAAVANCRAKAGRLAVVTTVMRLLAVMAVAGGAVVLLLSAPSDEMSLWAWVTVFVLSKLAGIALVILAWGMALAWSDDPLMRRVFLLMEED